MKRSFVITVVLLVAMYGTMVSFTPSSAEAKKPYKIGLMFPFTGPFSLMAEGQKQGAILAIEEINAAGGVLGRKIEYVLRDTELKPDVALRHAEKMVYKNKVDALIGTCHSGIQLSVNQWCKKNNVVWWAGAYLVDNECAYGVRGPGQFATALVAEQMYVGAEAIMAETGAKTFYITYMDQAWGQETTKKWISQITKLGGKVVGTDPFPGGQVSEWGPYLTKAMVSGADAFIHTSGGGDQISAIKAAWDYVLMDKMVYILTNTQVKTLGGLEKKQVKGIYATIPFYWEAAHPAAKAFVASHQARWGEPPDTHTNACYSAVYQLIRGVEGSKSTKPEDIGAFIMANRDYEGTHGPERMTPCHVPIQNMFVVRGKPIERIKGDWDFFDIIAVKGYDLSGKYMTPLKDLGYPKKDWYPCELK